MTVTATPDTRPDSAAEVLARARARRRAADAAEADLLELAVAWAAMHPVDAITDPATHVLRGFGETDLAIAGPGAPTVAEFCVAEFAAAVGLSTEAGKRFLGEAIELRYRLARHWRRAVSGQLPAWKARRVARETMRLSVEAAEHVDRHVAPVAHKIRPSQLDRAVAEAIGRFMPDEVERLAEESWDKRHVTLFDQQVSFTGTMHLEAELDIADALDFDAAVAAGADQRAALGSTESRDVRRAQAVGDLHLSEAARHHADPVARVERGDALVTVDQVRTWSGNPDAQVVVKPGDGSGRVRGGGLRRGARPERRTGRVARPDLSVPEVHPTGPSVPSRRPRRPCVRLRPRGPASPRRADLFVQPRPVVSAAPPAQDPCEMARCSARSRALPVDQPPRLPVPARHDRHPRCHARPSTAGTPTRSLRPPHHTGLTRAGPKARFRPRARSRRSRQEMS
jgi:hypothetical protein